MARTSKDDQAGLNHPSVKAFGSVDGAKKTATETDTSAATGTSRPGKPHMGSK